MSSDLNFNFVDALIVLVVLAGILIGIRQGVIRQVLFLGSLYIATILASQYFGVVSKALWSFFPTSDGLGRALIAYAILFSLALLTMVHLSHTAYHDTHLKVLPGLDLVGGALCGIFVGWVFASISLVVLQYSGGVTWLQIDPSLVALHNQMTGSPFARAVYDYLPWLTLLLRPWLPAGLPAFFAY